MKDKIRRKRKERISREIVKEIKQRNFKNTKEIAQILPRFKPIAKEMEIRRCDNRGSCPHKTSLHKRSQQSNEFKT